MYHWILLLWSVWLLLWPESEGCENTTDDTTDECCSKSAARIIRGENTTDRERSEMKWSEWSVWSVGKMKNVLRRERVYDSIAARRQKMLLLMNYGMLKEELNWPDIISIADNLYSDGHLQWHELEKIHDRSQPRRKAIDILLKAVLGNASSVSAFMKIVESKNTLSYIAERIKMTRISAEEMENVDNPPAQKQMKINHDQKERKSDALEKFASDLMIDTARQKLGNKARKHLDLDFKEAFWGPLGLMLSFQSGKPSQKLCVKELFKN